MYDLRDGLDILKAHHVSYGLLPHRADIAFINGDDNSWKGFLGEWAKISEMAYGWLLRAGDIQSLDR